ncbi:MAG TPA: hypothetical protein P5511_03405, partial [Candidatus Goldiibacteriota bacterium]|nr:hypothetical protein [Candidatus Goldiibacteriota bacterium]
MVSMDDDFKISMDDIKDMVSELFGEKIEKVEASKARDILREFTEEFLTRGIEEVAAEKLTQEEEKLLADYEASKPGRPASADELPEKLPDIPDSAVDMAR